MNKINPTATNKGNISKKINLKVNDLLLTTTVHALPNIARTEQKCLKLMWIVFFVISTSTAVYFTYENILDYLEFDVNTRYDVIYEDQSDFPTVSFCSEKNLDENLTNILTNCQYNANPDCEINQSQYFESFTDGIYRNCFRFNSGISNMLLKSTISGSQYGLFIDFNLKINDSLILSINNNTKLPYTLFNSETNLSTGSQNEFKVSRTFIKNLPEPYNRCYKDVTEFPLNKTIINFIQKANRTYTQKECKELYLNLYYLENSNCGCISSIEEVPIKCYINANTSLRLCTQQFLIDYSQKLIYSNHCPLECDSFEYSIDRFSTPLKGNEITIFIYYESLKYTLISQQPKTLLIDLIPNIGGILGLFIGISFLSFIEIIELFIEIILIFF